MNAFRNGIRKAPRIRRATAEAPTPGVRPAADHGAEGGSVPSTATFLQAKVEIPEETVSKVA